MRSAQIAFENKKVWIIGGGNQAWIKGKQFVEEGAKVVFLAPSFLVEIQKMVESRFLICKCYENQDIEEGFLVYACTDNRELNHQIVTDTNRKGMLSASVHQDVDASYHPLKFADYPHMHVAISTNGASPSYNTEILAEFQKSYEEVHHCRLEKLRKERENRLSESYAKSEEKIDMSVEDKHRKAILIVSYGTTVEEAKKKNIDAIEQEVKVFAEKRNTLVYGAFSSKLICKKLVEQNILVMNIEEALCKMYQDGIEGVIILTTHLLYGRMYDEMLQQVSSGVNRVRNLGGMTFQVKQISPPLLGTLEDAREVLACIHEEVKRERICLADDEALILMGHGVGIQKERFVMNRRSNMLFSAINHVAMEERYHYMWIGAMDGEPSVDNLISDMKQVGYHKIVLMPFMIVDGKHARKDMASDAKDSWKSRFQEAGIAVRIQMQGLGEIEGIRKMYVDSLEKIC